jgi:MFS family permease
MLLATRVLQGVGGAMLYGTAAAILTSTFPPQQRGKVLGIFTAGIYTGLSLGPVAGGFLVQNFGWRSVFLSNVPIAAIALLFAVLKLKEEWADAKGSRFDTIGTMIYVVSLSLIMLGASYISSGMNASTWAGINSGSIVMMSIGLFLMLGFVLWELKSGSPLLDVRLFKNNKVFAASNLSALINYGATYALSLLLSLYLQLVKGFSPQFSGFILLAQPIVQTVLSPLAGSMSDRVSPRLVTSLGMALNAVGLLFFGFIDAATDVTLIAAYLVIMGIGFALFSSPNTNALMGCVEKNCLGVASATLATMRSLGMIVSTVVAINVLTLFIGYVVISSAPISLLMGGIRESFLVFAILCFIGVAISVLGLRKQNSKQ